MDTSSWFMEKLSYPWNIGVISDGRIFFINEEERYATWIHPLYGHPVQSGLQDDENLPKGWQFGIDSHLKKYYINHLDQYCTYESPNRLSQNLTKSFEHHHKTASIRFKKLPKAKRNIYIVPTMQGWLYKESGLMKIYKKKFCVLSELCLFCYDNDGDSTPTSSYILPGYSVMLHKVDNLAPKPFAFKIKHRNTKGIYFIAETDSLRQMWVEALTSATNLQTDTQKQLGQAGNLVRRASLNQLSSRLSSPSKNVAHDVGHQMHNSGSLPSFNNLENSRNWNSPNDHFQRLSNNFSLKLSPPPTDDDFILRRQSTFPESSGLTNQFDPTRIHQDTTIFRRSNADALSRSSVNLNRNSEFMSPLLSSTDGSIFRGGGGGKYNGGMNAYSSEITLDRGISAFSPPHLNNPRYSVTPVADSSVLDARSDINLNYRGGGAAIERNPYEIQTNGMPFNERLNLRRTQSTSLNPYEAARQSIYTSPKINYSSSIDRMPGNRPTNQNQPHNHVEETRYSSNNDARNSYNNAPIIDNNMINRINNDVRNNLMSRSAAFESIKEDPNMADDMVLTNRTLADVQQHMLTHARLRLSISVQDLGGKTNEELVLFLIQLKRSQKKLQEDLTWTKTSRIGGAGDAVEEDRLMLQERDLTKQMEVTQPLINLLDNMITMGSLYNGEAFLYAAQYKKNQLPQGTPIPEKEMLTFSRRHQEQKLDKDLKRSMNTDLGQLDEMLNALHQLDAKMHALDCQIASLQDDKTMLSQTLLKLDEDARLSTDGIILRRLESQTAILRLEHTRVLQQIADTSKELEETKLENQKMEQKVILMRTKLFDSNKQDASSEHGSNLLVAQLEKEVSQMNLVMKNLAKQGDQLFNEMQNLKMQSSSLGKNLTSYIDVKLPQRPMQNITSGNMQLSDYNTGIPRQLSNTYQQGGSSSPYSPITGIYSVPMKAKRYDMTFNEDSLLKEINSDLHNFPNRIH